jgi:nucleotidyltransferase substrate binding protein (TIGR01987 family)
MPLELESLKNALIALEKSLTVLQSDLGSFSPDIRDTLRSGTIQNFEVAYEQSWKFMQRWLRKNQSPEEADLPLTRRELFRAAARAGLISDPSPWFAFGEARNQTSHTYDTAQALAAVETAVKFLPQGLDFLSRLERRND